MDGELNDHRAELEPLQDTGQEKVQEQFRELESNRV